MCRFSSSIQLCFGKAELYSFGFMRGYGCRTMGKHRFDPVHAGKLDDPRRLTSEPPGRILDALGVTSARVVVEIGVGSGYYTSHLSKIIVSQGVIVACDVSEKMLEILNRKNLNQTLPVLMEELHLPLKDKSADLVLAANVLHEFDDPLTMLREVFRVVQPGKTVGIVDWKKTAMDFGPPLRERLEVAEIESLLTQGGFESIEIFDIVPYHNVLSAIRGSG